MSVKITSLQAENIKRIRAIQLTPAPSGLTILGGGNNQGKTSVLDAIAWALGGDRFRPHAAARFGAWLEAEGLQAIATRVSTGQECQIIIEDGLALGQDFGAEADKLPVPAWKKGAF